MVRLPRFYRPCKGFLRLAIFETCLPLLNFRSSIFYRVTQASNWWACINSLAIRALKRSNDTNQWRIPMCVICFFKSRALRLLALGCQRVIISRQRVIWVAFHIFERCMGPNGLDFIIYLCYVLNGVIQLTIILLHRECLLNFLNLLFSIILKRFEFIHYSFHMLVGDIESVQIFILCLQRVQLCLWLLRYALVFTY